jgi:hypothetical protein
MARYIEFRTSTGQTVLVEVDESETRTAPGVAKAGLRDGTSAIASATESFDTAVKTIVAENVDSFTRAIDALARTPDEVELTFALKATGEIGNFAIAKVGAEANFTIKMTWKGGAGG